MITDTLKAIAQHINLIELDDRIEFNFTPHDISTIFSTNRDDLELLALRWNGELQDNWNDFPRIPGHNPCSASIKKERIIDLAITTEVTEKAKQYFFLTEHAYMQWLRDTTDNVFDSNCCLNENCSTVIWLGFSDIDVRGEKLSIISLNNQSRPIFNKANNTITPSSNDIKAQSHFVGQTETVCEPLNYKLPRDINICNLTQPFYDSYEKLLAVSLTKEFLGNNNVVINGIRRLNLNLSSKGHHAEKSSLNILEEVTTWVYSERIQVRLLLLMDRVSLDLDDNGYLLPDIYKHLPTALEQAKDKYEFVIKDRKEAHAKEMSDFQKDIKTATDSYSKSTNDLVTGLFRDALSAIFLLAIMLFSRLIGKEQLLDSENIRWLFKMLSIYLILTPIIRMYFEKQSLNLLLGDLEHWKDTTRNHISSKDVTDLIKSRTEPYKKMYKKAMILISVVSLLLSIFVWNIPSIIGNEPAELLKNTIAEQGKIYTLQNKQHFSTKNLVQPYIALGT